VKDYPTLLRAFSRLPESARLSVAGTGSEEKRLKQLARKLGVAERVRWLGYVDDLSLWLTAADGYVLSSLWEGLPLGLLEAESRALPVVTTAALGVREALPASSAEYIAPIGDSERLGEAMLRMMRLRQTEREVIGERNFEFVRVNYGLTRIIDQWEELYERLMGKNKKARRWAR
jgi:glycosyltransferase involved in cell wall biosynthesis